MNRIRIESDRRAGEVRKAPRDGFKYGYFFNLFMGLMDNKENKGFCLNFGGFFCFY